MIEIIFLTCGIAGFLMLGLLLRTSILEKKSRAIITSAGLFILFTALWFGSFLIFKNMPVIMVLYSFVFIIFILLFFMPIGKTTPITIGEITRRIDERDTIFAREEYHAGTEKYEIYYAKHPEFKEIDNKIRNLPELLSPGGRYYDSIRSKYISSVFDIIETLGDKVDGSISTASREIDASSITNTIKELTINMGADDVGIASLNPAFIYSHVGRGIEPWGKPINNTHRFAIVFALEMDHHKIEHAPELPATEESALNYLKGATISISMAKFIRHLGYPARAHIAGSNYQIMLPPVACDAGLGELGRMGYLISPRFGARIRLGAVTTDLPLISDKPIVFGVQDFCKKCLKCAINCPSNAIPEGDKETIRGVEKWQLNVEKCLRYWRIIGTDCGLCMKVCPYSHPHTLSHNIIRHSISRSSFARTVSIYGDDLLYGKKLNYRYRQNENDSW